MKNILLQFIFILAHTLSCAQQKAVFIIADGIPADVIEKLQLPNLKAIVASGAYLRAHVGGEKGAYSQTPTISAVGYNSLLTGTWVNKHNVWDNDILQPNYHYPTLFRILKTRKPGARLAVFSTWRPNRTRLIGAGLEETGKIQLDHFVDGMELDTIAYPHDKNSNYIHLIDEAVTDSAAAYIKNFGPDLSWVYLEYTDDMGHRYGDGDAFYSAISMMDNQVGRIWKAIQWREEKFGEQWQLFITTDHGRDSVTGRNHGGQSNRERNTWIITNAKNINPYFKNSTAAITDIMPTILSFLQVPIPRDVQMELDGVPLTGQLSILAPEAKIENGKLHLAWKSLDTEGKLKIWISTTNNFKNGGVDDYQLLAEWPISQENYYVDISKLPPSSMYKLVWEAPHNFLSRWVIVK